MPDFLVTLNLIPRLTVFWAMGLITYIVMVWADNVTTMTGPAAGLAGGVVGLFTIALLNWRKSRGIE